MTGNGWLQILLFLAVVLAVTRPLGRFMTRVFNRERTWARPCAEAVERLIYRTTGVDDSARDALDRVGDGDAAVQRRVDAECSTDPARSTVAALEPQGFGALRPISRSTPPPPSPPIRTGRRTAARRR
jgi:hypothetical protein